MIDRKIINDFKKLKASQTYYYSSHKQYSELYEFWQSQRCLIFVGETSLTVIQKQGRRFFKHKFIDERFSYRDIYGRKIFCAQRSREILSSVLKKSNMQKSDEERVLLFKKAYSPPFFFQRRTDKKNYYIYLDLKSAYYQIYSRLTFDILLKFSKNTLFGFQNGTGDFSGLETEHKITKRLIYGMMLHSKSRIYDNIFGTGHFTVDAENAYLNNSVPVAIYTTLHHIAEIARESGAIHINTDGYIFQRTKEIRFIEYLKSQNLDFSIKEYGKGFDLRGLNCYKIGDSVYNRRLFDRREFKRNGRETYGNIKESSFNFLQ
jgi:hypothetical protein